MLLTDFNYILSHINMSDIFYLMMGRIYFLQVTACAKQLAPPWAGLTTYNSKQTVNVLLTARARCP
jgi:hypothetical protein